MGLLSDSVGLLFTIKADSSQASKEFQDFKKEVKEATDTIESGGKDSFLNLAKNIGLSADQTAILGKALPIAGAALAGFVGTATAAAVGLFALAKNASDLGSQLYDTAQKTGLAAETLSAMKFAADQSGTSFEAVSTSTNKFAKLLGDAAKGSDSAKEKLKALGVTSTDMDTALGQAYSTINKLPEGLQQMTAAADAFGSKVGADLLPYIKSFDGDLAALTEKANKLGVTLNNEDVTAADNFGDSLDQLRAVAEITAAKFALQFAPVITESMDEISVSIANNQNKIKEWGETTGNVLAGIKNAVQSETSIMLANIADFTEKVILILNPVALLTYGILSALESSGKATNAAKTDEEKRGSGTPNTAGGSDYTDKFGSKSAENAKNKRLDALIKGLDLDIQVAKATYENWKKQYDELLKAEKTNLTDYQTDLAKYLDDYIGKASAAIQQKKTLIAQRFKGQDAANAETSRAKELDDLTFFRGTESLKLEQNISDRRIKSKEIEIKQMLEYEKAFGEKSLALLQNNENAYAIAKEQETRRMLEIEQKLLHGWMADTTFDLPESKKQEIRERSRVLTEQIEKAKTDATLVEAQRRKDLTEKLENETLNTQRSRDEIWYENERKKYEFEIEIGRNRAANLQGLLSLDLTVLDNSLKNQQEKLNKEKEKSLESLKGFEDEQKLKQEIEEYYRQQGLLLTETYEQRKLEIEHQYRNQVHGEKSGEYGGGLFGDFFGDMAVINDPMVTAAEKQKLALENLGGAYDLLKQTAGQALNAMAGAAQDLLTQWILTGKGSAKAFAQIAASALSSLVVQAGIKAIFELAEGWAAAARYDPVSATAHFTSAKIYGTVAGAAAVAAIGLRGAIGSSFDNSAQSGFGQQTSRATSGGTFNATNPRIINENFQRNGANSSQKLEIVISSKPEHIVEVIKDNIKRRDDLHGILITQKVEL